MAPATDPAPWRGALAAAAEMLAAPPHVLADPTQHGERGVWTTADDVLPGAEIQDGDLVVAAWGDHSWRAHATWDDVEPELLWLTPAPESGATLDLRAAHPVRDLAARALEALGDPNYSPAAPQQPPVGLEAALAAALEPLYQDVELALTELQAALARDRRLVAAALRAMRARPARRSRRLLADPAVVALFRLARRRAPAGRPEEPAGPDG